MSFADFGLLPGLLEALAQLNIKEATPVQRLAIPAVLGGKSVFVVARTGSGKTLAYAVPLVQRLHIVEQAEG
ncbi:MAG TPA: DEAD/DEAH box helicase, partial [Myxococcota bacterium]|nr:DEAD/DEAH box helicase [Myxococcota bacterium]